MAEQTPFIKPEPEDVEIPPAQIPSSSDLGSGMAQSQTSIQQRSPRERVHVNSEPRNGFLGASNPAGWYWLYTTL